MFNQRQIIQLGFVFSAGISVETSRSFHVNQSEIKKLKTSFFLMKLWVSLKTQFISLSLNIQVLYEGNEDEVGDITQSYVCASQDKASRVHKEIVTYLSR